jgi:serine/threonine-protein phosphatase 6 regulatory ankyrin repeat subunit B
MESNMLNITKFKQFISPGLLLASVLLTSQLTLSAADGGLRATASRLIYRAFGWLRPVDQALINAARNGNGAAVTAALAAGADVNTRDNDGNTALIYAAWNGHTATVTQLLAAGADVNARGNDGNTALIYAARHGHTAILEQLLTAGADVNTKDNYGNTVFILAAEGCHTAVVTQLLTAGADVNAKGNGGDTVLMWAARGSRTAIATQLLAAGANVNTRSNDGNTALFWATIRGHTAMVTQLLAAGADVNAKGNGGDTVLMSTTRNGHTAIATQLLAAGADVNARDHGGRTALMRAAYNYNCNTAFVTQLLAAGAEIAADLQTDAIIDAIILAQPEQLRTTPVLIRAITSGYHKQVVKAINHPDIITVLTTSDLSAIDFAQHKFIINPGVRILPDLDLLATGATRAVGELGPEITPEAFSILDLAILSGNLALVDQLLMSGLSPEHLTQQTRGLLESFPAPDSGAREAKGADDHAMTVAEADSEQIAQLIYYADMAHTTEIQNIVRGAASNFSTEPLPAPVTRYAKATKEFQAWARTQIVDLPVAVAMQVGSVAAANITDSAAVEPTAYDNSAAVVSTDSASNSYLQRALIAGGIALAVVAVAAIVRRSR